MSDVSKFGSPSLPKQKDQKETPADNESVSRDNDEKNRTEQALYASETKYRTLVEQASDGIHTYDFEGNFIEINSKLCEMLGYTPEELFRLKVKDLIPAEDLAENPIRYEELRTGKTLLKERRLIRKDGRLVPVEISGKMIQEGVLQGIVRDISERKAAEEKLKQSEERLRVIFEASHDGILGEDDEVITYVNKSYLQMFGYDRPEELIGRHISIVISPKDAERVLEFGKRRLRGEQSPIKYEFKGRRKNGTLIEVEASVSVSNVSGKTYVTTMLRDISERKRADEALRNNANQLRLITDAIPLLISFVDKDHFYRFVNRIYTEWFRQPKEKVVGRHVSEVLGQAAYRQLLPEFEKALSGEEVVFERLVTYASGKRFIHAQYIPEIDDSTGQVIGFHAFVQDISERKRAEEILRSSEELLQGTIDALTSNIAVLDSRGMIIKVNAAWREFADQNFLGDPNYSIGSNYIEKCVPAAKRNSSESDLMDFDAIKAISGVIKGDYKFFELEYPCHSPTETRWFVMRVTRFGEGENLRVVVAHENITPRKIALTELEQAQKRLSLSHEELEQKVQERTSELKKANESLQTEITERRTAEEERVKVLHQLVTAQEDERQRIARDLHDHLGQQLTALRLKLNVLKKMCGGNGELAAWVGETQKIARQLDLDVDFLAWQMRPSALNDLGIVAALADYVRQWSAHFNIAVEFNANRFGKTNLPPESETQLYRIAQEALNNVYKHAQAGVVNIMLEPRGDFAVLIIEDDGVGFEPNEQFSNGRNNKGLGLIGIHERAALVGGSVEIESAEGEGATIYVKIPISKEEIKDE